MFDLLKTEDGGRHAPKEGGVPSLPSPTRAEVRAVLAAVLDLVQRIDPQVTDAAFAMEMVDCFSTMENACSTGKSLLAKRVADSGAWRLDGDKSPADWVARKTGTTLVNAIGTLKTAKKLERLPQTQKAARSGKLSEIQTGHIADAAYVHPASERQLLEAAGTESVSMLKEKCLKVKASAEDENARREAHRRSRFFRYWTDREGAFRMEGKLTPEDGALLLSALKPAQTKLEKQARREGRWERSQAYAADALVAAASHFRNCSSEGKRLGPSAVIYVRVDHSALSRGHCEPGEICEIPGIGPIPVSTARDLMNDAFVAAVLAEGADITGISHMGRYIPSRLITALDARDHQCVVPGCGERKGLEIDHTVPISQGGPTALNNLAKLCRFHHDLKTHHGYRLSGKPGSWTWESPQACQALGPAPP